MQIDVIDAQMNKRPNGSVEVLGQTGHIIFTGKYAEKLWADYQDQLNQEPSKFDMTVALNIEVEELTGKIVAE